MRVLCVAEKPSISKSISQILSGGHYTTRDTRTGFIKNYVFDYPQMNAQFTVTAVAGHLKQHLFYDSHQNWNSCDPFDVFDAPVKTEIPNDKKGIEANLIAEAKKADMLMIWTDCDREGEHIGWEIAQVCRSAKRNINVKRARFSAIIAQQIHRAAQHPVDLDQAQADAVEARSILDLKTGAAFTRYQTKTLRSSGALPEEAGTISYGTCQFPTLGFVVARFKDVRNFIPEAFWYIYLALVRNQEETKFSWRRNHLFDMDVAAVIYQEVLANPTARVTKVTKKPTKKWKPLPLTTVELQKAGSRLLRLAPKKVLDLAESLYQRGFLSYPRTETDQFDPQFDFMSLIDKQTVDPAWGPFAATLRGGQFLTPRRGKNDDKAHPPIHPTAHVANLAGDEKRVYEFVTRRFLACCSKDATGSQTTVDVVCGGEEFYATGLIVHERNYLDVYPYDKWTSNPLPDFAEGEEFQPSICELRDGETSPPNFLTEADLVTLMDKNGIGTDATIAQHIDTIIKREYCVERFEGQTKYLVPSTLGIGLIEGYDQIGLDKSLSKPQLRRETERAMNQICQRAKTKHEMLTQALEQYKEMYIITKREFNKVVNSVRGRVAGGPQANGPPPPAGGRGRGGGGPRGRGGRGGGGGGGGRGGPGSDDEEGGGGQDGPSSGRGSRARGTTRGTTAGRGRAASTSTRGRTSVQEAAPPVPPPPVRPAPPPRPPIASTSSGTGASVNCDCGQPAIRRIITNELRTKGKSHWACSQDQCGFFQWTGDPIAPETVDPGPPVIPSKRAFSLKEGPNQGRKFWKCSENVCTFFEFDDEPPRGTQSFGNGGRSTSQNATRGGGGGGGGSANTEDECYKCHMRGHWASACPNDASAKRTRSTSQNGSRGGGGGGGGTANTEDECYKCHMRGHWASGE
ncbi:hypothetical protein ONZ45_g4767 [Pleurotus djamor]|nr:hypothetical protein ONZ45_g4767 [Pleurotus djamor]